MYLTPFRCLALTVALTVALTSLPHIAAAQPASERPAPALAPSGQPAPARKPAPVNTNRSLVFLSSAYASAPELKLDDETRSHLDLHLLRVDGLLPVWGDDEHILAVGAEYSLFHASLVAKGRDTRRAGLHAISVVPTYMYRAGEVELLAALGPSLNTDFQGLSAKDLRPNGLALLTYWFTETFNATVGAATNNAIGDIPLVPLLGLEWFPSRSFDLKILLPAEAAGTLHIYSGGRRLLDLALFAQLSGNQFRYRESGDGDGRNLGLTLLRSGLRVAYFPAGWLKISAEGGLVAAQTKGFVDGDDDSDDTKASLFLGLGVAVGSFWGA